MKKISQPLVFGLLIAFTSSGIVQKYLGTLGLLAYALLVTIVFVCLYRYGLPFAAWLRGHFKFIAAGVFVAFAVCFAVVYPIENGKGPGKSSDRDQGLNIAATRLVSGEYPYYQDEPEAGPLSVFPGSIIFATPFVAAGNSAYQNIFWLTVFVIFIAWFFHDKMMALVLIAVSMALSPSAMHEYISGGDLMSNGIFVALFSLLALRAWLQSDTPVWWRWVSVLLMGLALASRPNFLFILPLFGAILWGKGNFIKAMVASSLVSLVFCAVTLPFYVVDPEGFTPFIARAKIVVPGMPWADDAILVLTTAITLIASLGMVFSKNDKPEVVFSRLSVLVIVTPMIGMVILQSISLGRLDFGFMSDRFGLMYVPFVWLGWGVNLVDGKQRVENEAA